MQMERNIAAEIAAALAAAMDTHFGGKRISQPELSRISGVPQPTISRTLKGKTIPETATLAKLINALGHDRVMLTPAIKSLLNREINHENKGDLLPKSYTVAINSSPQSPDTNAEEAPAIGAMRRVPVVGRAQLGDDGYWAELETPVGFGDGFILAAVHDGDAYAVRCIGNSMRPRIKDGEFVILEPSMEVTPGDEVLVKATDGRVMVKELLYIRDDVVHLLSVNETHGKIAIPKSEIACMHLVTNIAKRIMWRPD